MGAASDFLKQCLQPRPADRPSCEDLKRHRYVSGGTVRAARASAEEFPCAPPTPQLGAHGDDQTTSFSLSDL
eukprot:NODE_5141_length_322_cov_132.996337_g4530_i0.p1 GENE.NODE_5141_length_322_cov_132.996337_g4530_i0~~NODE_5141_length_322_cov_132.996337_g4530_i0.p1  ORF type:complete len:79 (-),score=16.05 NODE_5141_length_322_cov_132.996337_g4530_i0:84-299(-)